MNDAVYLKPDPHTNTRPNPGAARGGVDFRVLSRVPRSLTRAYHLQFLTRELPRIAQDSDADAVIKAQIDFYRDATGKDAPTGITTSLGAKSTLGLHHVYKGGPNTWQKVVDWSSSGGHVELSDRAVCAKGNFVRSRDIVEKSSPTWGHFMDIVHRPEGVEDTVIANFTVPLQPSKRLLMGYVFSTLPQDTNLASRFEFDFVSVPFAIVWMFRFGVLEHDLMCHWLFMLAGLTPSKLFLIREIISAQRYQAADALERTGLTKRNFENHIFQLSEILDEKVPRQNELRGNGSALVDLVTNYGFLSFAGRPDFSVDQVSSLRLVADA